MRKHGPGLRSFHAGTSETRPLVYATSRDRVVGPRRGGAHRREQRREVFEKLTRGKLVCSTQAYKATLLFDPSMSALPIIALRNSPCVGLLTR